VNDQLPEKLQDQMLRFGGGADSTTLTSGTAAFVGLAILLLLLLPRRYMVVPFLFVSLFIPYSQVMVIGGLHFYISRILLPVGWIRVLGGKRPEGEGRLRLNGLDKAIILWAFTDVICATLLWGTWGAFINRMGSLYSAFGIYFLLRLLIRDRDDVNRVIRCLVVACSLFAIFMVAEQVTGKNAFSVFGLPAFAQVRQGRVRSQGPFAHEIVAGTVGATLVPLFIGLWWQGARSKILMAVGVPSAIAMAMTAGSATPVAAFIAGAGTLCLWPLRRRMRLLRWGLVSCVIGLHLMMKAPVWALIARINIVGGNSGYHRFELINQAVLHFSEWWLVGTRNPSSWGFEMGDVSNAYMAAAVEGGLFTLLFFVAIFLQSFRQLGLARNRAEEKADRKLELQVWSFGAALFATFAAYLGITYFDQSSLIWWALLAMISAITSAEPQAEGETNAEVEEATPSRARRWVPLVSSVGRRTPGQDRVWGSQSFQPRKLG
jgi:hypothetical protein